MNNLQCFKRVPVGRTFIHDEFDGRARIRVKYRKSSKGRRIQAQGERRRANPCRGQVYPFALRRGHLLITKAHEIALAKRLPSLFTYMGTKLLVPGLRWKHNHMYADLESLDTLNRIELSMSTADRDWFKTELWRAITSKMEKPLSAENHSGAIRSMYSASAEDRLTATLKTLRIT